MKKKAVFLDRDGTINIEKNYLFKIEDFEYLPGVKQGLKILQDAGFLLIIVTNQSGIARGYYTEDDYKILNSWMIDDLKESGINIVATYFCPHHPEAKIEQYRKTCNCRKPGKELFYEAAKEYNIDIASSYVIGDKHRDLTLCKDEDLDTRVHGYLIYSENKEEGNIHCIEGGLLDAAGCIIERENERLD